MINKVERISNEQEKIDNYIITTCITLLSAYVIIITIKKPDSIFLVCSTLIAVFSLSLTLLELLWHKFRNRLRSIYFDEQKEKIVTDYVGKIDNFVHTVFDSTLKVNLIKLLPLSADDPNTGKILHQIIKNPILSETNKKDKGSPSEIMQHAFEETSQQTHGNLESYLKNLVVEMRNAHEDAFNKPLQERNKRLKYLLDVTSRNTRYYFFVIGIISFFISIIFKLLK